LANTIQAKKRIRQNHKRRLRNNSQKSCMRTHLKRVIEAITTKDLSLANKELSLASSILDKLVKKGLIHKNKANRHKSRLCLKINALQQ
jgi:small subunit ribosomal protein S20